MGDASSGRSATTPARLRSTSVLTTTDWQCAQTVCTLLDHRYSIGAPQLGQLPDSLVMAVGTIEPADDNLARAEQLPKLTRKVPVGARTAAEQIQAQRPVFRK